MGFFSGLKSVGGVVFNFRVTSWIGLDNIKNVTGRVGDTAKSVFTPEQAEQAETFEEALERIGLTEQELELRKQEFMRLMIIYILIAAAVFIYSIFIAVNYKNLLGFFMGLAITLFALTFAFRYHFWIYQIKHKKLGCTFKDWFLDKE